MREWRVGDPIGDGNDIGVPDIPYIGYLRGDGSDKEDIDEFNWNINRARENYDEKNFEFAFYYLDNASRFYSKMKDSQFFDDENPFNQNWICEVCCETFNMHKKSTTAVSDFIRKNNLMVRICEDCTMIFPYDFDECPNCRKPFEIIKQDTEKVKEQIRKILDGKYLNSLEKMMLTNKAISLIKSNDSRLEEIRSEFDSIIFTFKKEHRYFYTEYECIFNSGYFREDRVFYDCLMSHNYDMLLKNDSFKRLIRETENKTGFTFRNCGGGYSDPDFDIVSEDFSFNSRYRVFVRFDMGENRIAVYDIDLDEMKLSDDYKVY